MVRFNLALVLAVLLSTCSCSTILSPHYLARTIPTPIYNKFLGTQNETFTITAELFFTTSSTICKEDAAQMQNKIVVMENYKYNFFMLASEQDSILCAQTAGAVATIIMYSNFIVPGFGFYADRHVHNKLTLPVAHAVRNDLKQVIRALSAEERVVGQFEFTPNKWIEMFDSALFFWLWKVILPIFNFIGVLVCIRTIQLHLYRIFSPRKASTITNHIMLAGSLVEFVSCILRGVYCAVGAMFSTDQWDYNAHTFLLNITVAFEVVTSYVAVLLFLRWGAFGKLKRQRYIQTFLLLNCVGTVPIQLMLALLQTMSVMRMSTLISFNAVVFILICMLSGVLFLFYGSSFVKKLGSSVGEVGKLPAQRKRSLRKATKWIMLSGLMQFVMSAGTALVFSDSVFYTPWGWFLCYTLLYFGLTGQALTQSMSFKPFTTSTMFIPKRFIDAGIQRTSMTLDRTWLGARQSSINRKREKRRASEASRADLQKELQLREAQSTNAVLLPNRAQSVDANMFPSKDILSKYNITHSPMKQQPHPNARATFAPPTPEPVHATVTPALPGAFELRAAPAKSSGDSSPTTGIHRFKSHPEANHSRSPETSDRNPNRNSGPQLLSEPPISPAQRSRQSPVIRQVDLQEEHSRFAAMQPTRKQSRTDSMPDFSFLKDHTQDSATVLHKKQRRVAPSENLFDFAVSADVEPNSNIIEEDNTPDL